MKFCKALLTAMFEVICFCFCHSVVDVRGFFL